MQRAVELRASDLPDRVGQHARVDGEGWNQRSQLRRMGDFGSKADADATRLRVDFDGARGARERIARFVVAKVKLLLGELVRVREQPALRVCLVRLDVGAPNQAPERLAVAVHE